MLENIDYTLMENGSGQIIFGQIAACTVSFPSHCVNLNSWVIKGNKHHFLEPWVEEFSPPDLGKFAWVAEYCYTDFSDLWYKLLVSDQNTASNIDRHHHHEQVSVPQHLCEFSGPFGT